jgi:uncharacterized protein
MFRILSLDGGGIKGAFTASALTVLEQQTGCSALDHFDLITGTSTGGILALGIGLGFPAEKLMNFYQEHGPTIFPSTGLTVRTGFFRQLFGPKHSHDVLRSKLQTILQDKKFGESKARLVIPTYDAIAGRIFIMKTAHHPRFTGDYKALAVDVALATSAAPTYFAAATFPEHQGASYVDGGVWANCPVMVGLVEAVSFLNQPLDQIDILSIGTTTEPFNIAKQLRAGIVQWNTGIIDLMFEAQMEAATALAGLLVSGRLHRINVTTKPGQFSLDDASPKSIKDLIVLGRGEAMRKMNLEPVKARFLNGTKAAPFVPIYPV